MSRRGDRRPWQTKRAKPSRLPHAAWLLDLASRYADNQDIKKAIDRAEAAVSVMRVELQEIDKTNPRNHKR